MFMSPVLYCFIGGMVVRGVTDQIRVPKFVYEIISLFLLISIGLKGGIELFEWLDSQLVFQAISVLGFGLLCTFSALAILTALGKYTSDNARIIAAHYGSVSVGTYAVALAVLAHKNIGYEPYMPLFVALLEFPAIVAASFMLQSSQEEKSFFEKTYDVFSNKSIFFLVSSIIFGFAIGHHFLFLIQPLFFTPFNAILALFLFEMGIVVGSRLPEIISRWQTIAVSGVLVTLVGGMLGLACGLLLGFSRGGTILIMTLGSSASYIAVPASLKSTQPESSISLALSHSLGVTFPFNVLIGIQLYIFVTSFISF